MPVWSAARRIILTLSIIIVVMSAVSIYALVELSAIERRATSLDQDVFPGQMALGRLRTGALLDSTVALQRIHSGNVAEEAELDAKLQADRRTFSAVLENYRALTRTAHDRYVYETVRKASNEYAKAVDQVTALEAEGKPAEAYEAFQSSLQPALNELIAAIGEGFAAKTSDADNTIKQIKGGARTSRSATLVGAAISIIISIVVGYLLVRAIGRAEKAVRASESRFHRLAESNLIGVVFGTADGQITGANDAFLTMTGYSRRDVDSGRLRSDLLTPPEYAPIGARVIEELRTRGTSSPVKMEYVARDGTRVPVLAVTALLQNSDRETFSFVVDLTNQMRADHWHSVYEAAVLASGRILYDWDPVTGGVSYAGRYQEILGYEAAEMTGGLEHWASLIHPEDRAEFMAERERCSATGESFHLEYRVQKRDGVYIMVEDDGYFIRGTAKATRGMIGFLSDVTERKILESELRRSKKMESIGTLAGGIAHDFNNILAAIIGYVELADSDLPEGTPQHDYLAEVLKASSRAKALLQQILAFSRLEERDHRPIRLKPIIEEVIKLVRVSLPREIEIRLELGDSEARVMADETEIHQIVMNLATNSIHAMKDREGVLRIELQLVQVDSELSDDVHDLAPGPYLRLTVSDNGHGMEAATLERVFDPFFTTKEPGEGTGLGLSVVHGIVKSCKGSISVHSEAGLATSFNLYFPVCASGERESPAEEREIPRGADIPVILATGYEETMNPD